MKELLAQLRDIKKYPLNFTGDEWYMLEYDVESKQAGIVVTFPSPVVGVQSGLSREQFLNLYPDFESLLPDVPHVVSFLEFATVEDFIAGDLEKAYVVYTDSANSIYEGITGYPISLKSDIRKNIQIAIPATEANLKAIPQEVLSQLPQTGLSYIRYNEDFSRISYEQEFSILPNRKISMLGVDDNVLHQLIADVREYLGIDKVQLMVKYTVGKESPKLYFALSYCKDCQDS
jgi:hypothetical protein